MGNRSICVLSVLAAVFLSLNVAAAVAAEENPGGEEAVFETREISTFDNNGDYDGHRMTYGASADCSTEPDKEVKAYPKLKSKRPLYGKLKFDFNLATGKAKVFHFVLDESGEAPAAEAKTREKKADQKKPQTSLLKSLAEKLTGTAEKGESDKSPPEKENQLSSYDRLYFDRNGDLDLTNDPVLKPMKDPPWQALPPWKLKERVAFEYLDIDVDYGPGLGVQPFRMLPWFAITENGKYSTLYFVSTVARQGRIAIGKHEYDALLAQPGLISGRYDRLTTDLFLRPVDPKDDLPREYRQGMLGTLPRIDGQLYVTSATPSGDKLTVKPYRGDFGIFKIGPGARDIGDTSAHGSLCSEATEINLEPDADSPDGKNEKVREYQVPVGDYVPSYVGIRYGRLSVALSDNYHSDGRPRSLDRPRTFFIKIRKDQPFVLDFANKPEVLFASPAKNKTFRPGDEVMVKAVLIDPALDIMIRGLKDTSRKTKETVRDENGKESTYERDLSLDPIVTITDSAGKRVAEGVLPFG
jgi:hypothetical protein